TRAFLTQSVSRPVHTYRRLSTVSTDTGVLRHRRVLRPWIERTCWVPSGSPRRFRVMTTRLKGFSQRGRLCVLAMALPGVSIVVCMSFLLESSFGSAAFVPLVHLGPRGQQRHQQEGEPERPDLAQKHPLRGGHEHQPLGLLAGRMQGRRVQAGRRADGFISVDRVIGSSPLAATNLVRIILTLFV